MKRVTVRILYKSGNSIDVKCSDWKVEFSRTGEGVTAITLNDSSPRFAFMGLENIEAIWRL